MTDIIPVEVYKAALERHNVPLGAPIEWKDRDGKVWAISEMADSHLENAMAMLVRNAQGIHDRETYRMAMMGDDPILGPRGDGANDAFDAGFNGLMDMDPEKYITTMYPPYLAMKAELGVRERHMQERIKDSRKIADWLDDEAQQEDVRRLYIAQMLHQNEHVEVFCGCHQPTVEELADALRQAEESWNIFGDVDE